MTVTSQFADVDLVRGVRVAGGRLEGMCAAVTGFMRTAIWWLAGIDPGCLLDGVREMLGTQLLVISGPKMASTMGSLITRPTRAAMVRRTRKCTAFGAVRRGQPRSVPVDTKDP